MDQNRKRQPGFTLLVNAGGESRRMGRPKALLPVPPHGEPLIRHLARRLRPLADEIVVIANDPQIRQAVAGLPAHCLPDAYPTVGPLGGLATGLAQIESWAICVACDMPFLFPPLFRFLCQLAQESDGAGRPRWDAIVPEVAGRMQPLHALYHRRCLPAITASLAASQRRMDSFLGAVRVRPVSEAEMRPFDPDLRSFFNVNTGAEWAQAMVWFSGEGAGEGNQESHL